MAIKTMTVGSSGNADYSIGWKELMINKAKYGEYNGKKYLDIYFDEYPDNFHCRVYEAINKKTQEEFQISNWFRFTQAGIQEVLDSGSKPIITYDDDAGLLAGRPVNVYIYDQYSVKDDRNYARAWRTPAPIVGEGEHLTFNEKDVAFWKKSAENSLKRFNESKGNAPTSGEQQTADPF